MWITGLSYCIPNRNDTFTLGFHILIYFHTSVVIVHKNIYNISARCALNYNKHMGQVIYIFKQCHTDGFIRNNKIINFWGYIECARLNYIHVSTNYI